MPKPRRLALIIANSDYSDSKLSQMEAPKNDAEALKAVLLDEKIGFFDKVEVIPNQRSDQVLNKVERFFTGKNRDDLLLLYFSGHGVLDSHGHLYLATKNTESNLLFSTSVSSNSISELMDRSRSKKQILILDCCYSGAFARHSKGSIKRTVGTGPAFEGDGSGRFIMTATDATQYAWVDEKVFGKGGRSRFTHHFINGLKTGKADHTQKGHITIDDLYEYVSEQVKNDSPEEQPQTPQKWQLKWEGRSLHIAKNPNASVVTEGSHNVPNNATYPIPIGDQTLIEHQELKEMFEKATRLLLLGKPEQIAEALNLLKRIKAIAPYFHPQLDYFLGKAQHLYSQYFSPETDDYIPPQSLSERVSEYASRIPKYIQNTSTRISKYVSGFPRYVIIILAISIILITGYFGVIGPFQQSSPTNTPDISEIIAPPPSTETHTPTSLPKETSGPTPAQSASEIIPTDTNTPTQTPTETETPQPTETVSGTDTPIPSEILSPTATVCSPKQVEVIATPFANFRFGPGLNYDFVESGFPGATFEVVGQSEDGFWYQIRLESGDNAWVANWVVEMIEVMPSECVLEVPIVTPPTSTNQPSRPTAGNRNPSYEYT